MTFFVGAACAECRRLRFENEALRELLQKTLARVQELEAEAIRNDENERIFSPPATAENYCGAV